MLSVTDQYHPSTDSARAPAPLRNTCGVLPVRKSSSSLRWARCGVVVVALLVAVLQLGVSAPDAHAWKMKTHAYSANLVLDDVLGLDGSAYGKVTIPPYGEFDVDPDYLQVLQANPEAFRAGSIGPDGYPDIYVGQAFIHPEPVDGSGTYTDDWLSQQWVEARTAWDASRWDPFGGGQKDHRILAFQLGFMTHAGGDLFGHTYVNDLARGSWPAIGTDMPTADKKIIARHMIAETYIDSVIPEPYFKDSPQKLVIDAPNGYVETYLMTNGLPGKNKDWNPLISEFDSAPVHLNVFFTLRKGLAEVINILEGPAKVEPSTWATREYLISWREDIDEGLTAWVETSDRVSQHMLKGESQAAKDDLQSWLGNHLSSMAGTPDWLAYLQVFVVNIIPDAVKDAIIELGKTVRLDDLLTQLTLGMNYDEAGELTTDLDEWLSANKQWGGDGKPLFESDTLNTMNAYMACEPVTFVRTGPFGSYTETVQQMDWSEFPELYDTVVMAKLVLIGPDGVNEILQAAGETSNPITTSVMLGFQRTLDGSYGWENGRLTSGVVQHHPLYDYRHVWCALFKSADPGLLNGDFDEWKQDGVPMDWREYHQKPVVGGDVFKVPIYSLGSPAYFGWARSGPYSVGLKASDYTVSSPASTQVSRAYTYFVVKPGLKHRASVWVRTDREPETIRMYLEFYDSDGVRTAAVGSGSTGAPGANAAGWTQMEVAQQAPANAAFGVMILQVAPQAIAEGAASPIAAFDDASVVPVMPSQPTFSPGSGYYQTPQLVEIESATSEAEIYYTSDGSEPTRQTGYKVTGPLQISRPLTLHAKAFVGEFASDTGEASYDFPNPIVSIGLSDEGKTPGGDRLGPLTVTVEAQDRSGTGIDTDRTWVAFQRLLPTLRWGPTTYRPYDGSFSWPDEDGRYKISAYAYDNSGLYGSTTRDVTIDVNSPPVAVADSYLASRDETLAVAAAGVLLNDTDVDGVTKMTRILADDPRITYEGDWAVMYNGSGGEIRRIEHAGAAELTFQGTEVHWLNGGSGANNGVVDVFLDGEKKERIDLASLPDYTTDTWSAVGLPDAMHTLRIEALGESSNPYYSSFVTIDAFDVAAGCLTARVNGTPSHGALNLSEDGSFQYTPEPGFYGTDTFTYLARDEYADSEPATVTILVNARPVALDDPGFIEVARLLAGDGTLDDGYGQEAAYDGQWLMVGAPMADGLSGLENEGAVYVFRKTGASWRRISKIVSPDPGADTRFGRCIALEGGTAMIVGGEDVYVYELAVGSWHYRQTLPGLGFDCVALDGNVAVSGAPAMETATVFTYDETAGDWIFSQELTSPEPAAGGRFGAAVAMEGDALLVSQVPGLTGTGAVYAFEDQDGDGAWLPDGRLGFSGSARFGECISLSEHRALVGDPNRSEASFFERRDGAWRNTYGFTGTAYGGDDIITPTYASSVCLSGRTALVSEISSAAWGSSELHEDTGDLWRSGLIGSSLKNGLFGSSFSMHEGTLIVGAPSTGMSDALPGAVYVFERAYLAPRGTLRVYGPEGVLANDRDPEGGPIGAELVGAPREASLFELFEPGGFSFQAAASPGFHQFSYRAYDNRGARSDIARANILVPPNTGYGNEVRVDTDESWTLIFERIDLMGTSTVTTSSAPPSGMKHIRFLDTVYGIRTTASYSGTIEVYIPYELSELAPDEDETSLTLWHWDADLGQWVDVTKSVDTATGAVFGVVDHLSPFVVGVVINEPPIPDAGGPYIGTEGSPIILDASASSDPDGDALTFAWDFDGDGVADTTETTPTHTWVDDFDGTVALEVSDSIESSTTSAQVTIVNVSPVAGPVSAPTAPVTVGTEILTQVAFTDPGLLDTHTVEWEWGDGTVSDGLVSEFAGAGTALGTHSYAIPGVYGITATVTDKDGGTCSSIFEYVVAYDPSAGFVTGGGWITSPAGAYVPDPTLEGRATFGFVSRYKKGAIVPDGSTEFQFRAGDLNFHSDTQQWLVVNQKGMNAQFKCTGTINGKFAPGSDPFDCMIWAGDGNGPEGQDTFRIKIWYTAAGGSEVVIYDNLMQQPIGGGLIVVHVK